MLGELRALEFLHAELGEVIDIISDRGDPSALPSIASGFAPLGSAATGAANREKTEQNRGRLKKILHALIADLRKTARELRQRRMARNRKVTALSAPKHIASCFQ